MPDANRTHPEAATTAARSTSSAGAAATASITEELVRQVADKVYAMLLKEYDLKRERSGAHHGAPRRLRGGRAS
ncbi:MAG: hypothetical protein JXA78_11775 [Anaerolineales bacterium]|nr:hypothetical protein [Anaerolineales bacterium]